jgi:hypothetical protein
MNFFVMKSMWLLFKMMMGISRGTCVSNVSGALQEKLETSPDNSDVGAIDCMQNVSYRYDAHVPS